MLFYSFMRCIVSWWWICSHYDGVVAVWVEAIVKSYQPCLLCVSLYYQRTSQAFLIPGTASAPPKLLALYITVPIVSCTLGDDLMICAKYWRYHKARIRYGIFARQTKWITAAHNYRFGGRRQWRWTSGGAWIGEAEYFRAMQDGQWCFYYRYSL